MIFSGRQVVQLTGWPLDIPITAIKLYTNMVKETQNDIKNMKFYQLSRIKIEMKFNFNVSAG